MLSLLAFSLNVFATGLAYWIGIDTVFAADTTYVTATATSIATDIDIVATIVIFFYYD